MAEIVNAELVEAAQRLAKGSAAARQWVREVRATSVSVDNEASSLTGATRRAENIARKVRGAAGRRNCVGVFGPSQAGKSYLVSALARRPKGALTADFAGRRHDFLREINPPGDRESTGLVTRFTLQPAGAGDPEYPVSLRLLSETDLVKILANSFFSDFDQNNAKLKPASGDEVRRTVEKARTRVNAQVTAVHLDEIELFDLGEYFRQYFANQAATLDAAGYWEQVIELAPRLSVQDRAELFGVLWNSLSDFTTLLVRLVEGLERLRHAPEASVEIGALIPREANGQPRSIIDVAILGQLGTPADEADLLKVLPPGGKGGPVSVPRALLTALVAELRIVMTEKPWDFFDHTDLLDFPGARGRLKLIDLPADPGDRERQLRELLLRGKVAYLFQRFTEERELTSMLLCMPPSVQEVKDLPAMIREWIMVTHGNREARAKVANALFLVLTKFDMDFVEKGGETAESRRGKWDRRLNASFLDLYGGSDWPHDWDGKPFANTFFLRNPGMKQEHIIEYERIEKNPDGSERLIERGPAPAKAALLAEHRAAFLDSPLSARHFTDMAVAWDAAFRPNDGGVSYLVERLGQVLKPKLKAHQIAERLGEEVATLDGKLRRFYLGDDEDTRQKREQELMGLRRTLFNDSARDGFHNFFKLLGAFSLGIPEAREVVLNVAALRVDAMAHAATAHAAEPDPWANESPTMPRRGLDRAAVFAREIMNAWTGKLRVLSQNEEAIRNLGFKARVIDDVANELIVGATRLGLSDRIAEEVRARLQTANVRWDESTVADRAATMAAMVIDDYVAYLGFVSEPEDKRPGFPEPPRQPEHPIFARPADIAGIPVVEPQRSALERQIFLEWGVALRHLGVDNVGFSGGREISPEQNKRLSVILQMIAVKPLLADYLA